MDGTAFSNLLAVGVESFCKSLMVIPSDFGGLLGLLRDVVGSRFVANAVS